MIPTFTQKLKNQEIDLVEHTRKHLEQIQDLNTTHHAFSHIASEHAIQEAARVQKELKEGKELPLAGVFVSVKDGICVKGMPSASSAQILQGYKPLFNATAVQSLINKGAIVIGKTTQDVFGFGSFGTNNQLPPRNPQNLERVCGGSSAGAAAAAKLIEAPHIALGESTGGSIVAPAAWCGTVGLCPTYGRVSRYGIIDYANSLDKIGPLTQNVATAAHAMHAIQGFDIKDTTSSNEAPQDTTPTDVKGSKVGILTTEGIDPQIEKVIQNTRATLEEQGVATKEITLPKTHEHALASYYIIAMAEASTNLAKYCGMRYGPAKHIKDSYNEAFSQIRSELFEKEAKRRVLLGTFTRMAGYRDAYYKKAAQLRTLIIEEYQHAFKEVDAILSPTMPIQAPTFKEAERLSPAQSYAMDQLTVGPNLAGLPHITVPVGSLQNMPVGVMLTGKWFREQKILSLGAALE